MTIQLLYRFCNGVLNQIQLECGVGMSAICGFHCLNSFIYDLIYDDFYLLEAYPFAAGVGLKA